MSLRSKTQKAKKFGTPSAPSPTAQKSSPTSPRATGGAPSAPSSTAQKTSSPKTYGITQTQAGQTIQEQFKTEVQRLTAPLRNEAQVLSSLLSGNFYRNQSVQARKDVEDKILEINEEITKIEKEQHETVLQSNVNQIIQAIESGNVLTPDYFQNNIAWVKTGAITHQAFLDSYYYLSNQGIIHSIPTEPIPTEPLIELPELLPEAEAQIEPIPIITPKINGSISTNMVTQQVINFNIVNGRAVGSIKFVATNNFNPYYYNKNIVNIIQIKDPNGVNILTTVKQNTRATIESFVWSSATAPTPFSKKFMIDISEGDPPHPKTSGFMAMGAAGAIAGLVLLGFIVDSKVGK